MSYKCLCSKPTSNSAANKGEQLQHISLYQITA